MADQIIFDKECVGSYETGRVPYLTMENYTDFETKLLISSVGSQAAVNYQLNYAFNDDAYAYVFGDRLTLTTLTGIAIAKTTCGDGGSAPDITPDNFVKFYNQFKLGAESTSGKAIPPAVLSFGSMVVKGYFISMSVQLMWNREDAYTFTFQFLGRITT
jgi:hypothetical protein